MRGGKGGEGGLGQEEETQTGPDREAQGPHSGMEPEALPQISVPEAGEAAQKHQTDQKKGNAILNTLSNLILIAAVAVLAAVLVLSGGQGPRRVAGFYAARVLTGSMEDVYPTGSLIVAKDVDPSELKVGDDITYMANETTTITHRIVDIVEDYDGSGQRAFITQGTMNEEPDKTPVIVANVVGKVVFHNLMLGKAMKAVHDYWQLMVFYFALAAVVLAVLKRAWSRKDPDTSQTEEK